jgi:hypothetical protein
MEAILSTETVTNFYQTTLRYIMSLNLIHKGKVHPRTGHEGLEGE